MKIFRITFQLSGIEGGAAYVVAKVDHCHLSHPYNALLQCKYSSILCKLSAYESMFLDIFYVERYLLHSTKNTSMLNVVLLLLAGWRSPDE